MKRIAISLLIIHCCLPAAFAQTDPTSWTFDTDVNGWVPSPHNQPPTIVEWDADLGNPPGTLRLNQNGRAITEECFPAEDGVFILEADAYMKTDDGTFLCNLNWALYETDDCSDLFGTFLGFQAYSRVVEPNQWEHLNKNIYTHDPTLFGEGGDYRSVRPILNKNIGDETGESCLFDNVYLKITPTARVPTASPVGLAVLVVLLAAAAFVVLRRDPGE